jgi:hypothetical protein
VAAALDILLKEYRRGSEAERRQFLRELANRLVFVPLVRIVSERDTQGTRKIQIVSEIRDGHKHVSAFTAEERFEHWVGELDYQCFSLAAGDLALTLPAGSTLCIDAGSDHALELDSDEVQFLAFPEPEEGAAVETAAEPDSDEDAFAVAETAAATDEPVMAEPLPEEREQVAPYDDSFAPAAFPEQADSRPESSPERNLTMSLDQATSELSSLLEKYPGVEEAYLASTKLAHPGCVLGVLSERLGSEERFGLIEGVANISRSVFGEAGAIEVYDDLNSQTSRSWDLFNTLAPFYSRQHQPSDHGAPGFEDFSSPRQSPKPSLWKSLRGRRG